jgi:hypothetical protein
VPVGRARRVASSRPLPRCSAGGVARAARYTDTVHHLVDAVAARRTSPSRASSKRACTPTGRSGVSVRTTTPPCRLPHSLSDPSLAVRRSSGQGRDRRPMPHAARHRLHQAEPLRTKPAVAGQAGHDPQVASHPDRRASRRGIPPQATWPTPDPAIDPRTGAAPGAGEQQLGISASARRDAHARNHRRAPPQCGRCCARRGSIPLRTGPSRPGRPFCARRPRRCWRPTS